MLATALILVFAGGSAVQDARLETSFALVAQALDAAASSEEGKPNPGFPSDAEVWENGVGDSSLGDFADYARECPLDRIERFKLAQAPQGETLVAVSWACADREASNEALFSLKAGSITRISFGPMPIVRVR
jgi:hypothetical protein